MRRCGLPPPPAALALAAVLGIGCAAGKVADFHDGGDGTDDGPFGCLSSADCDDGDTCTTDDCDRSTGQCTHRNACCQSAADCEDQNACTEDTCERGACKHQALTDCCLSPADCDDSDPCTEDICKPGGTCNNNQIADCCNSDPECDDGDPCTQDACVNHGCEHSVAHGCCATVADCDDADPCTQDACDQGTHACSHTPVAACCHDAAECDDGNQCTTDGCDTGHQCTHAPVAGCCNASADCDDHNACTTDVCDVSHQCTHPPVVGCCNADPECGDGNACTNDVCNTTTHQCAHTGVPGCCTANADCDDHNVCNGAETCDGTHTCQPGTALGCNDGNACTDDSCDPTNGCQHATHDCNDGDACTTDGCTPSTGCTHTAVSCDDGDICTVDGCNFTTGCTHSAVAGCAPRANDLCANAIDVSGGGTFGSFSGSTLGAHHEVDAPDVCLTSTAGKGGADVFYKVTLTAPEWISLDTFGSPTNTVIYVMDQCGGTVVGGTDPFCNDDSGCDAPNALTSALAVWLEAGTWIIVVDSFGPSGAGAFTLHVGRSGATCGNADVVDIGTPVSSDTSTTNPWSTNVLNPTQCTASTSGREQMFVLFFCPMATFGLEAWTCGSTLDSMVYLRGGTCTSNELGCNDDGCSLQSDLRVPNLTTAGGMYFLIVDTYPGKTPGPFTLTVDWL